MRSDLFQCPKIIYLLLPISRLRFAANEIANVIDASAQTATTPSAAHQLNAFS